MDRSGLVKEELKSGLAAVAVAAVTFLASADGAHASMWDRLKTLTETQKSAPSSASGLSDAKISDGLKEALRVGTERVVARLGQTDGFNKDPVVHIPLPQNLQRVKSVLGKVGLSSMTDDLELRLNRAAEKGAPQAKALFVEAVKQMTLDDVRAIYQGPDDAATRYFQGKMSQALAAKMQPIVADSLNQVGAVSAYQGMMARYNAIPLVPKADADLTGYVINKGMEGIFHYLAKEEAAIRKDPVSRSTELLKLVFGRS